jgi:hypothetical protein
VARTGDACVVHHGVQTAERLHREGDKLANLFRFPDIALLEGRVRAAMSNDGLPALPIDVCDDNPSALLEKPLKVACPIPDEPPVTMATFPFSAVDISRFPFAGPDSACWRTGACTRGTGADRGCAAKAAPIDQEMEKSCDPVRGWRCNAARCTCEVLR